MALLVHFVSMVRNTTLAVYYMNDIVNYLFSSYRCYFPVHQL